jgi:hypothetical protein
MNTRFTIQQLEHLQRMGLIRSFEQINTRKPEQKPAKRTKHNNVKVETEDGVFDSKKEYKRYKELRILLKAGEIGFLAKQVQFELNEGGTHSLIYIADFVYTTKEGKQVVEDVKGMRTAVYKKKRKLMKEIHGIEIVEI